MHFVRMISSSGDGYLQVGAIALLTLLQYYPTAQLLLMLFALERILYWLLKNTLKRPRPQESFSSFQAVIEASDRFSFPSGHTSAAFLLSAVLSPFFLTAGIYWMVPLLFLWATAIAVSRVLLGVHYPTDTLAGAALGLSVATSAL